MNRSKVLQIVATAVALVALGIWSYSSGSSTPISATGASVSPTTGKSRTTTTGSGTPSNPGNTGTRATAAGSTTTIVSDPAAYAAALYRYWTERDRTSASKIATAAVVTKLFSAVWHKSSGWTAKGCIATATSTSCTWARRHRNLVIQARSASGALPVLVVSAQFVVV